MIITLSLWSKTASSSFPSLASLILYSMLIDLATVYCPSVDYCYSDIGCFPLSDEFYHPRHRPFNVRPWHRNRIKTQFELYNRQHPEGYLLEPWNRKNLKHSHFNPLLETKIIIPGWLDNIKRVVWMRKLRDALLWSWHPVNIIVVHWRNFTPYTIATANTRVVGAELANLLKSIEHELNYHRTYYHLIGHSLGAHIAGYCGDRIPGLGRITALDPARPFFQHMPKSVRLDRADAKFVDAIHSDFTPENAIFIFMSFGMTTPVGHVDFYPNGPPLLQPGCLRDTLTSVQDGIKRGIEHSSLSVAFMEATKYLVACDHQRSHEWFLESITNRHCLFVGVRCNEYEGLINGRCTCDDSPSACAIMGIHADQMYLNNVHEDLWPLGSKSGGGDGLPNDKHPPPGGTSAHNHHHHQSQQQWTPPSMAPVLQMPTNDGSFYIDTDQIPRPTMLKEQLYSEMRHQADKLRQLPSPQLANEEMLDAENLESIEDALFVDYLRSNFLLDTSGSHHREASASRRQDHHQSGRPLDRPNLGRKRQTAAQSRQDGNPDDDFGLTQFLINNDQLPAPHPHPGNKHATLMSDLDRNIERWYEGTSRWYLKTGNRPNYCVNQYQVLVFLGPLKTTTGHKHIRANLVISIIGSRGQMLNQRFFPRGAKLDSYTMQPFFIILEGSYSLGDIISVAISWEARVDPDPVQATISFQSNLLENVQSYWPTYKAKHPFLSETMKYDYSGAFRWRHPPTTFTHHLNQAQNPNYQFMKRVSENESGSTDSICSHGLNKHNDTGHCLAHIIDDTLKALVPSDSHILRDALLTEVDSPLDIDDDYSALSETIDQMSASESMMKPNIYDGEIDDTLQTSQLLDAEVMHNTRNKQPQLVPSHEFLEQIYTSGDRITAKLHNLGIHQDINTEDSLVINQVVVQPLHASYGQGKASKVFCPPHLGYRLARDRTVRLIATMIDKCQYHHQQLHEKPHLFTMA